MVLIEPAALLTAAALFGLAIGSFLNVIIIRTHLATSPWRGRSRCVQCGHGIAWYDNIPLVSFTWLRGRCRHCRTTLSWQYPLVEAGTAIVFLVVAQQFGMTWWTLWAWMVSALMIAIAVYDARWSLLPDSFTIALAIAGFGFTLASGASLLSLLIGAAAGVAFFGLQYLISRGRWVGSGDILLGGALGIMLGWRMLAVSLQISYLIGALVASILLLIRRQTAKGAMAFGPFLVLGAWVVWLWGSVMVDWFFSHVYFY